MSFGLPQNPLAHLKLKSPTLPYGAPKIRLKFSRDNHAKPQIRGTNLFGPGNLDLEIFKLQLTTDSLSTRYLGQQVGCLSQRCSA